MKKAARMRGFFMEAAGIEPASRDNTSAGLYMLSRWFNLVSSAERRHPSENTRRLYLAAWATPDSSNQPAVFGRPDAGFRSCRDHLFN